MKYAAKWGGKRDWFAAFQNKISRDLCICVWGEDWRPVDAKALLAEAHKILDGSIGPGPNKSFAFQDEGNIRPQPFGALDDENLSEGLERLASDAELLLKMFEDFSDVQWSLPRIGTRDDLVVRLIKQGAFSRQTSDSKKAFVAAAAKASSRSPKTVAAILSALFAKPNQETE